MIMSSGYVYIYISTRLCPSLCLLPSLILKVTCFLTCNFEKLILYVLLIDKRAFRFAVTILVMTMFDFQFWWSQDKNMYLVLFIIVHISNFIFTFFNVLLDKSNCFRTMELHVVQLIVILFHLIVLKRFDIVLFQINFIIVQIGQNMWCFARFGTICTI